MNDESMGTPRPVKCNHVWKKVEGTDREDGSYDVVCECGSTMRTDPIVREGANDKRPLLME